MEPWDETVDCRTVAKSKICWLAHVALVPFAPKVSRVPTLRVWYRYERMGRQLECPPHSRK